MALRIFYAAGPGDVISSYEWWKAGKPDPSELSATFSGQFYELCGRRAARGLVLAHRNARRRVAHDGITIRERPLPGVRSGSALRFHAGQLWEGVRMAWDAWRFGADVAIIYGGTHWFMLTLMRMLGIRVVPDLACTLWPTGRRPRGFMQRMILRLNGWFWAHVPSATLCMSPELIRQIDEVSNHRARNLILELPSYQEEYFRQIPPAAAGCRPFVVLFAGRVERTKGVFDFVEMLKKLEAAKPGVFKGVVCGSGRADAELARAVSDAGLSDCITLAGQVSRADMAARIAAAHLLVVPTTAAFPEGLNRVAVEGVLAGRPVLVTLVCPAWELLGDAVVVVAPGDVDAMAVQTLRLESDATWYEQKRSACRREARQFCDPQAGWDAAVERALELALPALRPAR